MQLLVVRSRREASFEGKSGLQGGRTRRTKIRAEEACSCPPGAMMPGAGGRGLVSRGLRLTAHTAKKEGLSSLHLLLRWESRSANTYQPHHSP